MKKIVCFLMCFFIGLIMTGCQAVNNENEEEIKSALEEENPNLSSLYYETASFDPVIDDDSNFDISVDLLEEASGHWINHFVCSRLPGDVMQAISSSEITLYLGIWEKDCWKEYPAKNFWRNDAQLVRFDEENHYLKCFSEITDKNGKINDFSDCLTEGNYYLKATLNDTVYKSYFELSLPEAIREYITSSQKICDIVFIMDVSGSMNWVRYSFPHVVDALYDALLAEGINASFSLIQFSDITVESEADSTKIIQDWTDSKKEICSAFNNIKLLNGGDYLETALDGLGCMLQELPFRNTSKRFCFLLTDAPYKNNNNYGYESMDEVISELTEKNISTSVIGTTDKSYKNLYKNTGGFIYSNKYASYTVFRDKISSYILSAFNEN